MANRFILLLPSYCVAPDRTILWPNPMRCGCKLIKVLKQNQNNFLVLTNACDLHYDKCMREMIYRASGFEYEDYDNGYLPIINTSDLE